MKTQKELNNVKDITCILDLPEQIFRKIFRHISTQELFFTIRKLNRDVKKYVEDYLSLQGVFILIREQNMPTLVILIFKREGNKYVTHSTVAPSFPMLDHSSNINVENAKLHLFPLLTMSTAVQGPLLFGVHSRTPSRYFRGVAERVAVDLHGFDADKCCWKHLKTRYVNINGQMIICSVLNDSTLLMFHSTGHEGIYYKLKLISICVDTVPNSYLNVFTGHGKRRMNIPEEIQQLSDFSVLTLSNDSIALIGGRYGYYSASYGSPVLNRVIWQGTLTDGNTTIQWDAIDIGGSCMGCNPICFKLKNNVYITGDRKHCSCGNNRIWHSSCLSCTHITNTFDRYNYKEKKMYTDAYAMPDELSNMCQPVQIATDKNETFAVFVFKNEPSYACGIGCEVKMLIFTEEDGFVQVYDNERADKEPENVCNRFLKRSALVCVTNLSNNYSLISG